MSTYCGVHCHNSVEIYTDFRKFPFLQSSVINKGSDWDKTVMKGKNYEHIYKQYMSTFLERKVHVQHYSYPGLWK